MIYSYSDVSRIANEVVREAGEDFIYEPCPVMSYSYSHAVVDEYGMGTGDYIPGCIVGRVMAKIGWRPNARDMGNFRVSYDDMVEGLDIELTPRAIFYLDMLQKAQDTRSTWGMALDMASGITSSWGDRHPDTI